MTDLETLVRNTLADEADRAPTTSGARLLHAVERRRRSRRPGLHAVRLAAVAAVALAVVVGLASVLTGSGSEPLRPAGSSTEPLPGLESDTSGATAATPDGPLVTRGECAGLTVRLAEPDSTMAGGARTVRPLVPGDANRWTTDGNQLLYLQAEGPCTDRLTFDVVEPDGEDRVQGGSGDTGQRIVDGLGSLITHAETPGTARIELVLGCASGDGCRLDRQVVAVLALTVTEPDVPLTTGTATPLVTTTVTSTVAGTVTSTTRVGPPAAGTETVRVTEGAAP